MAAVATIEEQRIKLIFELLKKRLGESKKDSLYLSFEELKSIPLLANQMAFEQAIRKICERSGGGISYKETKSKSMIVSHKYNDYSTANTRYGQEGPSVYVPPESIGYEILVLNPNQLEVYFAGVSDALSFDTAKSRLYVRGEEIKIRKFTDQYHTLRIIFENPADVGQEWFFSEIAEKIDSHKPNEKRYYNAIHQVRLKLASAGFSDFFTTTKQSLKINQKYLS